MKIFPFLLLAVTVTVGPTTPSASEEHERQGSELMDVMEEVQTFCIAGRYQEPPKSEDLGLHEKDRLLPGMSTVAAPATALPSGQNTTRGVFLEEMPHNVTRVNEKNATTPKAEDPGLQECKQRLDRAILLQVIEDVKHLDATLDSSVKKTLVPEASSKCTPENICKAGKVLEGLRAEDLGLEEKDWLLPRRLAAYTRDIQCKDSSDPNTELQRLLSNIQLCAQKMFATRDHHRDVPRHQDRILIEIIQHVRELDATLDHAVKKMSVPEAMTRGKCTLQDFCTAGKVLEGLRAEVDLRLDKKDWILPRKLAAYTRLQNVECKNPEPGRKIELRALLRNIDACARKLHTLRI